MRKFNLNILWLVLLMPFLGYSQDVLISDQGTVVTCSGNFYDSGGDSGNYTSNENYTITLSDDSFVDIFVEGDTIASPYVTNGKTREIT